MTNNKKQSTSEEFARAAIKKLNSSLKAIGLNPLDEDKVIDGLKKEL